MSLTFSTGCGTRTSAFYILTKDSEKILVKQLNETRIVGRDAYVRMSYLLNEIIPDLKSYMTEHYVAKR